MADHDSLVREFRDITGAKVDEAREYLTSSSWDLDSAITAFFADQDEGGAEAEVEPEYTGPRTLDGRPAPQYAGASSSSAAKKPAKRTGLATLSSLGGGHSHDDDEDDDDEDDEDDERRGPRDLFAGGEKSGLAVQDPSQRSNDPKRLIDDIVAKAKADAKKHSAQQSSAAAGPSRHFVRGGHTLGGDGVESRRVGPPPSAPMPTQATEDVQERTLHIWNDGFSVDDGELRRFDDPAHQEDLNMIRQGRAPLHLMNVRAEQRVDVKLHQHNENWKQLPKIYRPFSGAGHRLGSPVPGVGGATAPPPAATTTQATPSTSSAPTTGVDESQPTLMLRIQLPDGTRLPARFNTTQTVADVYDFVSRSSSALTRPWVLSTTFPNKEHTQRDLVLGEMPEFKKGGTAVVKWI